MRQLIIHFWVIKAIVSVMSLSLHLPLDWKPQIVIFLFIGIFFPSFLSNCLQFRCDLEEIKEKKSGDWKIQLE